MEASTATVALRAHPYDDTDVVDSRAPRTNQAFVGLMAAAAFVTDLEWLVAIVAVQLAVGLTFGRRYCLPCVAYFELLQPRLGEGRLEDSRPPRFANMIGLVFTGTATVAFLAGLATFAWVLTIVVAALALLAATSGICVGCEAYMLIARARGLTVDRFPERAPA